MRMLYVFSTVAIFIGSVVGAGFASGREIALYFGSQSVAAPIVAGLVIGFLCYVFLEVGRLTDGKVLQSMFGRFRTVAEWLLRLSNFAVYAAMIAGSEFIVATVFGVRGGGVVSGILCMACISFKRGLAAVNAVLTPLIIVLVGVLVFKAEDFGAGEGYFFWSPLSYASMNLATGGYLISRYGVKASSAKNAVVGALTAATATALLVAVYFIVREYPLAEMPLFVFAERRGLAILSGVLIYAAIFTTMTSCLAATVENGGFVGAAFATSAAFLIAIFGFATLVNAVYPIIGALGIGFTAWSVIVLIYKKYWNSARFNPFFHKRNRRIHKTCKHAQNEG